MSSVGTAAVTPTTRQPAVTLGPRARATSARILSSARGLFLEQGFNGTTIEQIAERAGVSKASFYTYFPTKRDAFLALGRDAYRSIMEVIDAFDEVPTPATRADIEGWVGRYWDFMEEFGAFIIVAVTVGPSDEQLRSASRTVQLRAARHLGRSLRSRQDHPTSDEEALGLCILAMLERAWYFAAVAGLPTDPHELQAAQCDLIEALLHR